MGIEETIQSLESRIKDNPKSILFARLADLYLKRGEIDRAVELCEQGIQHHPSYVTGSYILGKAYIAKGLHDRAETEFKKVISHDRQFLSAHKHLGDIMARMGWENKAALHYRDILRIDPMDDYAHQMLDTISPGESMLKDPVPDPEPTKEALPRFESEPPAKEAKDWDSELDEVFTKETTDAVEESQDISDITETGVADPETTETEDTSVIEDSPVLEEKDFDISSSETEEIVIVPALDEGDPDTQLTDASETSDRHELVIEQSLSDDAETAETNSDETGLLDAELEAIFPEKPDIIESETPPASTSVDPIDVADPMAESSIPSGSEILDSILDEEIITSSSEASEEPPGGSTNLAFESEASDSESRPPDDGSQAPNESPLGFQEAKEDNDPEPVSDVVAGDTLTEPSAPMETPKAPLIVDVPDETESAAQMSPSGDEFDPQSEGRIISPTLGEIYAAQGQYSKAVKVYEMLIQKKPDEETKYRNKIDELKQKLNP